ncbi:MAG: DUF1579 family protein [Hyphomicrobiales bacterium]|nr:DUF1579 family protein [Hyphomicrobiales bacterium]
MTLSARPNRKPHGLVGLLVLTAALSIPWPTPARADDGTAFLERIAGEWRGRGTAKRSADAKTEAVACQLTTTLGAGSTKISNAGNCTTGQGKVKISGQLAYNAATGVFSGSWFDTAGSSADRASGRLSGSTLRLNARRYDEHTNQMSSAEIVISASGADSYELTVTQSDPAAGTRFVVARMSLKRRN